ncbi:branched-chain amino acid ABC transporter permease [Roseomonas sp. BN140053]|uniref:branched-chain amino acid ABC transporter permease n=1 Tax=Roseomonas sp. BN140053 TaxID=3391898 RepID=UPI0039ECECF4
MDLLIVLEQLLNGLQLGMLLFLIAAGLTLVFGIMGVVNLAHGSFYMLGAFAGVFFVNLSGSFLLGCLAALLAVLLVGVLVERLVLRPLQDRGHLDQVLATFGLILFFNEAIRWVTNNQPMFLSPPEALSGTVELLPDLFYPAYRLAVIVTSSAVALLLWLFIARTRAGMLIRAGATHGRMVRNLGVDIRLLYSLVFGLGAALAGLAGLMVGPLVTVEVGMGEQVLILALVIVVLGGIGSVRGTFIAALLVGMLDSLGRAFMFELLSGVLPPRSVGSMAPAAASLLVYLLMAAVLIARPQGLFRR